VKQPVFNFKFRVSSAFTLIEIMVVVVLLSVIILGLTAMFLQTQRAFRAGMTQTDVQEAGRMATEMISRELEQITPSYVYNSHYFAPPARIRPVAPNVFVQLANSFAQPLVASSYERTNIHDDLFFIVRENLTWRGIGYFVRSNENLSANLPTLTGAAGTLYRYEGEQSQAQFTQAPDVMFASFDLIRQGNTNIYGSYSKITDGVIGFKVRTYDRTNNWLNGDFVAFTATNYPMATNGNFLVNPPALVAGEAATTEFYSNAVPAFIEFELAVLEQGTYARFKNLPVYDAQTNFLAHQVGRVHVFRQRVAVRNVDPIAYQ
jgi:prepilin-type N-terminal cleavage/methylation domain-containing protein